MSQNPVTHESFVVLKRHFVFNPLSSLWGLMEFNAASSYPSSFARLSLTAPVHPGDVAPQPSVNQVFNTTGSSDTQHVADLLTAGYFDLTATNTQGQTLLHRAIALGNHQVALMLIGKLQPHQLDATDLEGRTLLMTATEENALAIMEALIQAGANIDTTMPDNTTALMHAVARNDRKAALLLLSHGADVNHVDINGRSALMNASEAGHWSTVTLLLNFAAKPDLVDMAGNTAAQLAERNHHFGVTHILHSAGQFLSVDDDNGLAMGYLAA